jgi:hypothetical protein
VGSHWRTKATPHASLRTIYHLPELFPLSPSAGFWSRNSDWLAPLLGTPVYAVSAFALSILIGLAAASVGALLGFLFGVPRPISDLGASTSIAPNPAPAPPPSATNALPNANAAQASSQSMGSTAALPGPGWQASTNLTQVSDWLTKIIVGVGLVEATTIYQRLSALSESIGGTLFDGTLAAVGLGSARHFAERLLTAFGPELTHLGVHALAVGRDAGIAVFHGRDSATELRNSLPNCLTLLRRSQTSRVRASRQRR